ncbi:MAG: hypothetical protein IJX77_06225 [Ruminococcus sp.]|nr:hypothetical protein [Ruminococcus sp.]
MANFSLSKIKASAAAAVLAASAAVFPLMNASAQGELLGYRGDLNHDMSVNSADLVQLSNYIENRTTLTSDVFMNADLTADGDVNALDLVVLRKCIVGYVDLIGIYDEETDEPQVTTTTTTAPAVVTTTTTIAEAPAETTTTTEIWYDEESDFISAPIAAVNASLPSQGSANLVIFYVDFPDCQYTYDPTAEEIDKLAFGEADSASSAYPFESMSAFYERSSKGSMNLSGKAFRYTAKENQSAYDTDKVKLAEECYEAFKDSVDFSQFDGDGDGMIDATLFTVPTAAGDDNWWPCAGAFGDGDYRVDGMSVGHIITGNAQIESASDYSNFVSSYLHEMGHCMGLPDYYLYVDSGDFEGFHGEAGIELMDADAMSDFSSFSKLMLGWYKEDQIQVYDSSKGSQTFTLSNAQTDEGNCIIIPYGELDDNYFSEYFIIEYASAEANNSGIWWQNSSGIRIHHVKADLQEDYWWTYLKYQNGSEYTNGDNEGIRLIRIVNDVEGDNFFYTGDVVNSSVLGFGWYDSSENESVDPGVTISIGDLINGEYTVTID